MADGYRMRTGEMSSVAGRIKDQVEPIGEQADRIDDGQVGANAFGRAFHDLGAAYTEALRDKLVGSIRAYATATSTLADMLSLTHGVYGSTDQRNAQTVAGVRF